MAGVAQLSDNLQMAQSLLLLSGNDGAADESIINGFESSRRTLCWA